MRARLLPRWPPVVASSMRHYIVAPPFTALASADDKGTVLVPLQDMHGEPGGAYTGESPARCWWKSTRRHHWPFTSDGNSSAKTDESVNWKVKALAVGPTPIICVGELLASAKPEKQKKCLCPVSGGRGCVDRCRVLAYHSLLTSRLSDWDWQQLRPWKLRPMRTASCGNKRRASFTPERAAD